MDKNQKQIIANNKKAYHDYFVLETYEAGIELFGTEIKSIRNGRVNLKDSFCSVDDGEMFVIGMHISPYEQGNRFNRDPMRKKRLLLHKKERATVLDRKSTRLNSSHSDRSRMPSSA